MGTINYRIPKKISEALKKLLKRKCSELDEIILLTQIKLWLKDNHFDDDERIKYYFNLSSGRLFERHVVSLLKKQNWKLVSWRSDKILNDTKPETNQYPDIVIECCDNAGSNGFKIGDRIAIECKWTNHKEGSLVEKCAISKMPEDDFYLENALKDYACCFYYAIGVGWKITSKKQLKPEAVFFIPANKINEAKQVAGIRELLVKRKPILNKKNSLISLDKKKEKKLISELEDRLHNLKGNLDITNQTEL